MICSRNVHVVYHNWTTLCLHQGSIGCNIIDDASWGVHVARMTPDHQLNLAQALEGKSEQDQQQQLTHNAQRRTRRPSMA